MLKENAVHWFPMRVRHSSLPRLKQMKERLDGEKAVLRQSNIVFDTYLPLRFIQVNQDKMDFAPCLLNYIFVRSSFAQLVKVKQNLTLFEPLRFVMHPVYDERDEVHSEVLWMTDKSMSDYQRIMEAENAKILFLTDTDYANLPSREVQIIEGPFTGVIGRIKRIKGLRCVVLPIGKELAPAIVDVPNSHLRYLTDEEVLQLHRI